MTTPDPHSEPAIQDILGVLQGHTIFLAELLKLLPVLLPSNSDKALGMLSTSLVQITNTPDKFILGLDSSHFRKACLRQLRAFIDAIPEIPDPENT